MSVTVSLTLAASTPTKAARLMAYAARSKVADVPEMMADVTTVGLVAEPGDSGDGGGAGGGEGGSTGGSGGSDGGDGGERGG